VNVLYIYSLRIVKIRN